MFGFKKRKHDKSEQIEQEAEFYIPPEGAEGPRGEGKVGLGKWKFEKEKIIYNGGANSYSVAIGILSSESSNSKWRTVAIRWNGSYSEKDIGFPKTGDASAEWFPIPSELSDSILGGLANLHRDQLLESLSYKE